MREFSEEGHVLVIDDSAPQRRLVELALAELSPAPTCTLLGDPTQVMRYLLGLGHWADRKAPSLILLDYHMPHFNGGDVLRELRSDPDFGGIPVILMSGSPTDEAEQAALREGANEFHRKPATVQELIALLQQLQRRYLLPSPSGVASLQLLGHLMVRELFARSPLAAQCRGGTAH